LRLIRDTEIEYKPFVGTLHNPDAKRKIKLAAAEFPVQINTEGNQDTLKKIVEYEKSTENLNTVNELTDELNKFLIENFGANGTQLFFYDKQKTALNPLGSTNIPRMVSFIRLLNNEGSIDLVFENSNGTIKPEVISYTVNEKNTELIIIPIKRGNRKKGILLITSLDDNISKNDSNLNLVMLVLNFTLNKIELLIHKHRMKELTNELQEYQSKIQNDNRVLAVGEMGVGAIEGILNPMQVIMSYTDMIEDNPDGTNSESVRMIKTQVGEISKVISGLIKFSNREKDSSKVQPLDINQLIKEYQKIAGASLNNKNYELLLDLQKGLPMIISNSDYIYQLLTNVFTIILTCKKGDGGILIQTKSDNNLLALRFICTSHIPVLDSTKPGQDSDMSLGIIKKLMEKHQGSLKSHSNPDTGSSLVLNFPLQRKNK
jgi:signal transduction histidine kinase